MIFNEDGINVALEHLTYGGSFDYLYAVIAGPFSPAGEGNCLHLIYVSVLYDLSPFCPLQSVSFEFCDFESPVENLGVNGVIFEGDLTEVPEDFFSGILVDINSHGISTGHFGKITLIGDVQQLVVGGQGIHIDNLCVNRDLSPVPDVVPEALTLGQNFPNPFNPSTTLTFNLKQEGLVELTVVDLAGRRIATLLDEVYSEGEHQVVWNGRDDLDRQVAHGSQTGRCQWSAWGFLMARIFECLTLPMTSNDQTANGTKLI